MNMIKRWTFGKHVLACLVLGLFTNIVATFLPSRNQAVAIGIIGGADGPTAIFITGKLMNMVLQNGVLLLVIAITLLLYKPMKRLIEREPKQN